MKTLIKFESQVEADIRLHHMLVAGESVLVAVSGGPDSVALLSVLLALSPSWSLSLRVVHFNHGIRGREAEQDAAFVKDLCDQIQLSVSIMNLNLKDSVAKKRGVSLQHYARQVRYDALFQLAERHGIRRIAVGHTADDQAETVLMWMIRGSGTGGLGGMSPVRDSLM